ncbi:MAG TPA: orotidine-5'-phosphate decarboxylase, partial [Egibacteraceae bacterium]|nr:orotidine-5'-phosphate decarboxylase [Egibacteraceae bacterium]
MTAATTSGPLVVALDTPDLRRLAALAAAVDPYAGLLKVGLQAYTAHGPAAVQAAATRRPVFLDLKLHDIPSVVAGAAEAAARLGVRMLTVHASGGPAMIAAAVRAAPTVTILAVTVLTSLHDAALAAVGQPPAASQVQRLVRLAADAGAGGIVCAPEEVRAVRAAAGGALTVVVPGIRPHGWQHHDQSRVATPRQALSAGADHIVVGRPITDAPDPAAAAAAILREALGEAPPEGGVWS